MKAFLLAAGFGTRLKPLTDTTPKCLVPIAGKPLLQWWFELLAKHGVGEVLVNTHYLASQVSDFIDQYNAKCAGFKVTEFYEAELLGSGGTVAANRSFVAGEEDFLICYADNLTDMDLTKLIAVHKTHENVLTMALFRASNPTQCGIAALDDDGNIVEFVEKPAQPKSDLANAGVYVANRRLFDYFPSTSFVDFGKDVLPKLTGQMTGYETNGYLIDIGTPENYKKAQEDWIP